MRHFWGTLHIDTAILVTLVVILLAAHILLPSDNLVARLTGEGFAALLAFLRGNTVARKEVEP